MPLVLLQPDRTARQQQTATHNAGISSGLGIRQQGVRFVCRVLPSGPSGSPFDRFDGGPKSFGSWCSRQDTAGPYSTSAKLLICQACLCGCAKLA